MMMLSPFRGQFRVTQAYKPGTHNGMDLVGDEDKTVYAICDGYIGTSTIITDKSNKTWEWGNYVKLVSDNDDETDDGLLIYYCHLSKRLVSKGQKVKKGDPIGVMGNTGYSFGAHLHFEIRDRDNKVKAVINTPAVTNIPNKKGTYESEDEELMSKEYDELKAICDKQSKQIAEQQKEIAAIKAQNPIYNKLEDIPDWGRKSVEKAISRGYVKGSSESDLNLPETMVREIVILDRMGCLCK
ncbi:MAG: M23 family metallopeptidase [Firmicutes bacterium]|nr:M23 family metallopeptidase [Bacillota bacterium]